VGEGYGQVDGTFSAYGDYEIPVRNVRNPCISECRVSSISSRRSACKRGNPPAPVRPCHPAKGRRFAPQTANCTLSDPWATTDVGAIFTGPLVISSTVSPLPIGLRHNIGWCSCRPEDGWSRCSGLADHTLILFGPVTRGRGLLFFFLSSPPRRPRFVTDRQSNLAKQSPPCLRPYQAAGRSRSHSMTSAHTGGVSGTPLGLPIRGENVQWAWKWGQMRPVCTLPLRLAVLCKRGHGGCRQHQLRRKNAAGSLRQGMILIFLLQDPLCRPRRARTGQECPDRIQDGPDKRHDAGAMEGQENRRLDAAPRHRGARLPALPHVLLCPVQLGRDSGDADSRARCTFPRSLLPSHTRAANTLRNRTAAQ
jgi:hypothetical protein